MTLPTHVPYLTSPELRMAPPLSTIPKPTLRRGRSEEFNEAFEEGFQFGYVAGTRDSMPPVDQKMKDRACDALYRKIYGAAWDGESLRMIGIRNYVTTVLDAALQKDNTSRGTK